MVPGLVAAHAMQTAVGETTYPVMGMIKWQRVYDSMLATPLASAHVVGAHLGFVLLPAGHHLRGVHADAGAVRGLRVVVGAVLAFVSQVLSVWPSPPWSTALDHADELEEGFGVLFRLGVFPLFLFSGAFFPVANLGEVGSGSPADPAVARREPLPDVLLDNVDWPWPASTSRSWWC